VRPEAQFLQETIQSLEDLCRFERVSRQDLATRMGVVRRSAYEYFEGRDLKLSTVARIAAALGYRAKVVFEHGE
jgi:hypothetical protein